MLHPRRARGLLTAATTLALASSAAAQITTPLPFYDSFEGTRPSPWWTFETTGAGHFETSDALSPLKGQRELVLGAQLAEPSSVDAILALDLAGETQVDLSFAQHEYSDGDNAAEGVYFSTDGATWSQVFSLTTASGTSTAAYQQHTLDVDQLAAGAGLTLTTPFFVRFHWEGAEAVPGDGFGLDNVWVRRAGASVLDVPGTFATVQAAIDAALPDDVVLVQPGTYTERIDFKGKPVSVIGDQGAAATHLVAPFGGFHANFPQDPVVRFVTGEGRASQLFGFTIRDGFNAFDVGSGIFSVGTEPMVRDVKVTGNEGGGVRGEGVFENVALSQNGDASSFFLPLGGGYSGSGVILNSVIRDNDGLDGGGVWGSPTLVNTTVVDNTAWYGSGGGWWAEGGVAYASAFRDNATFDEHTAGGVFGPAHIVDCLVLGNNAVGGMACGSIGGAGIDGAAYVRNTTVVNNQSGCLFPGVYPGGIKGAAEVVQSIVWANTTANSTPGTEQIGAGPAEYSLVEGGFAGTGNLSANPQLGLDFKPLAGSPAIDAGHPAYPLEPDGTPMDLGFHTVDEVDLDQNGYPDYFEFALGFASDCNRNGFRDGLDLSGVTDTDFNGDGLPDSCVAPPLDVDITELVLSAGGQQSFALTAPANAGEFYILLGSLSLAQPGTPVGGVVWPLSPDAYTSFILGNPLHPLFTNFVGVLPASGVASAALNVPPFSDPALVNQIVQHAYLTIDPTTGSFTSASNPVPLVIL